MTLYGYGKVIYSRQHWLEALLKGYIKPGPPTWWVQSQVEQGRTMGSAYAIWHRSYKPERKYVIWDQAGDDDWRAAGYLF